MRASLAVAIGGLIGTGLRLGFDLAFPHPDDAFPVETLLINLTGAFALGVLAGGLWRRPSTPQWVKAGVGAGVLGSFTTLSAVAAAVVVLGREGAWWTAGGYLLASVAGGLAAAALGLRVGSSLIHRRMPRSVTDHGETL
ncbi:fluoride efflux transporter FluC [Agromyces sp. MMS24-K17]|uniref:fluoride efflux transporter FluC n=1 Tax=Agromyces sp. MMS24-K17 TaxID=3372850 RepID=UPI003754215A